MIVSFSTKEVADLCSSHAALDLRYGLAGAALIRQRLFEIAGAPSVERLTRLPCLDCARQTVNGRQRVLVRVDHRMAIVFEEIVDGTRGVHEAVIIEIQVEADT